MDFSAGYATKKAIFKALYDLTREKTYESIKIPDICNCAGVSRSTFYHHFNSKFDVICWHYELILALGVNRVGISLGWFDAHLITTTATRQYYDLYSKVRQPNASSSFFTSYYSQRREAALRHAIVDVKRLELTPKLAFQVRGLPHAEEWAIREWYRSPGDIGIKEICEYMVSLVPRDLYHALEIPEMPDESTVMGALVGDLIG